MFIPQNIQRGQEVEGDGEAGEVSAKNMNNEDATPMFLPRPLCFSHPFEGISYEQIKHYIAEHFPKVRGVTRIDIARTNTHGWEVRIRRRGINVNEFYSDLGAGGIKEAYETAIERRNVLEQDTNLRPYSRSEIAAKISSRNTSGIVGVHRTKHSSKRSEAWTACGSSRPCDRKVKHFYISKYGEEEAKSLAIEQRKEWETQIASYEQTLEK
jgi:hypothetical protein